MTLPKFTRLYMWLCAGLLTMMSKEMHVTFDITENQVHYQSPQVKHHPPVLVRLPAAPSTPAQDTGHVCWSHWSSARRLRESLSVGTFPPLASGCRWRALRSVSWVSLKEGHKCVIKDNNSRCNVKSVCVCGSYVFKLLKALQVQVILGRSIFTWSLNNKCNLA